MSQPNQHSVTPQAAGLVVYQEASTPSDEPQGGPRSSQVVALAVITQSSPSFISATPQTAGLVVFEY